MDPSARTLSDQGGVISRAQALTAGLSENDIRRLLRRREWVTVRPGVYVDHTGPLSWHQQAWSAVLWAAPSALYGVSAIRAADGPGSPITDRAVHVVVDRHRSGLRDPPGVVSHRVTRLEEQVLWNVGPPRQRYHLAALACAEAADRELDAVAWLAKACASRRTTAQRMLEAAQARPRLARRHLIEGTLLDVAAGTCSVLEHGFLTRVERPHGLPTGRRQVRATASTGVVYRDVEFGNTCEIELDGRLYHDSVGHRDADFERDLDAAAGGHSTVRLAWGQVFDRPCTTAAKLVQVLERHGVRVTARACRPGCPLGAEGQVA